MKKLVLVIRAQEVGPRMNVQKRWSAIQGNASGNYVDTDKHYRNAGGGSPKISKEKIATIVSNVLQLTL